MPPSKKKKQDDGSSSDTSINSSDGERSKPAKKAKVEKAGSKSSSNANNDPDSIQSWDLGGRKFAKVRTFKNRLFVDIREYYIDKNDGDMKPGKKGISLGVDQWKKLCAAVSEINDTVKENA